MSLVVIVVVLRSFWKKNGGWLSSGMESGLARVVELVVLLSWLGKGETGSGRWWILLMQVFLAR